MEKQLCKAAIEAMKMSYSPYSEYCVGAALLGRNGKIYTGCNVENAAMTPTNCAERTAVFKAVSEGERNFVALAVAGGKRGALAQGATPCGICRQVLAEFCDENFPIYVVTGVESFEQYTLGQLLPHAFGPSNLTE